MSSLLMLYLQDINWLLANKNPPNHLTSISTYLNNSVKIVNTSVSASLYRVESIRDSFITGFQSAYIRQRLLENSTLTLQDAFEQARSLDIARQHADSYSIGPLLTPVLSPLLLHLL